ncbi:hypothetical protein B0G80_8245 [Paraburkholderia sp. BL6669N2]|nr:hypothetical protein B0G80_8245 [Paraburkholderia sp. BL6669N2]
MGVRFHASNAIIERQKLKRPYSRVAPFVVDDERRHEAGLERHFAARKTLSSLNPAFIDPAALAQAHDLGKYVALAVVDDLVGAHYSIIM